MMLCGVNIVTSISRIKQYVVISYLELDLMGTDVQVFSPCQPQAAATSVYCLLA